MSDFSYLPDIDFNKLIENIKCGFWEQIPEQLSNINYERVGLDRLLTILIDMNENFGKFSEFEVLDIGCNNGLFSIGLAACENHVIGIDNFEIDSQQRYDKLLFPKIHLEEYLELVNTDIDTFLNDNEKMFDFVLLLSVAHQWENGYAQSGKIKYTEEHIKWIMENLLNRVRNAIYYECPFDEPGFEIGYGRKFLEKYISEIHKYKITEIDITIVSNGYQRQLFRIERV